MIVSATGETRIMNPESKITLHFAPSSQKELPKQFALYRNYPNPFNPTTTIRYDLPKESRVRIVIYDALGQVIRQLIDGDQSAGYQLMVWDGRNEKGNSVASGMYFYQIEAAATGEKAGVFNEVRKMLVIR